MTLVWPAKLSDGIKLYSRVHSSSVEFIGKLIYAKNKQKVIKG